MTELESLQQEVEAKTQKVGELEPRLAALEEELRLLQEQAGKPWQVTCSACNATLTITPPTVPVAQVLTMLYCPLCGAEVWQAPTEGYTISPGIVGEEPWYKKYAPHLIAGGGLAAALIYFTRKKRGKNE